MSSTKSMQNCCQAAKLLVGPGPFPLVEAHGVLAEGPGSWICGSHRMDTDSFQPRLEVSGQLSPMKGVNFENDILPGQRIFLKWQTLKRMSFSSKVWPKIFWKDFQKWQAIADSKVIEKPQPDGQTKDAIGYHHRPQTLILGTTCQSWKVDSTSFF